MEHVRLRRSWLRLGHLLALTSGNPHVRPFANPTIIAASHWRIRSQWQQTAKGTHRRSDLACLQAQQSSLINGVVGQAQQRYLVLGIHL